jgi:hypothetical protein
MLLIQDASAVSRPHPRQLGWVSSAALAMGGSNQSLFLIAALFVGQGDIPGQGSAAVPLLIVGLLLSWAAAPAWTELVLMWPNRVGGISAACAEAFRPYSPVLSAITGTCYWWGWVPTCGLTALLSASAIQSGTTGRGGGKHDRDLVHRREFVRNKMGRAIGNPDCRYFGLVGFSVVFHSNSDRQRRLASGDKLQIDDALPRLVWGRDIVNGRTLPHRICGSSL